MESLFMCALGFIFGVLVGMSEPNHNVSLIACTGVASCINAGSFKTKADCEIIKAELKSHPTINAYICEEVK